jgi:hypothetical protein
MEDSSEKVEDQINQKMEESSNKKVQLPYDLIRYIFNYLSEDVLIKLVMAFGMEAYFKNVLLSNKFRKKLCDEACKEGYLNTLIWARDHGCPWNCGTCYAAAGAGHLHILQWARANGCDWDKWTCSAAAKGGHLHILKWAKENGYNFPKNRICKYAAKGGHVHILQWARENGCSLNEETCYIAAGNGHLDCLIWAIEQGCPWNRDHCLAIANSKNYTNMIEWIERYGKEEKTKARHPPKVTPNRISKPWIHILRICRCVYGSAQGVWQEA